MVWSSTHITWDLQMMVLELVLPAIFIACLFLTIVVPPLLARQPKAKTAEPSIRNAVPQSNS